jgi:hypothetical protein
MADQMFPPPAAFSERAWIKSLDQYNKMYERSIKDPDGFWGEIASEFHWYKKWDKVRDYNFDRRDGKIHIRRRQDQHHLQRPGPAPGHPGRPGRDHLGGQRAHRDPQDHL